MGQGEAHMTSGLDMMAMTQPLSAAAASTPTKIATRLGDRIVNWSDLQSNVARLAGALKKLGVKHGDRVAILALNSDRYTEYQFATWWAGGVVVPMNVRWSPAENAYSLNDAGAEVLFVDETFAPMLPAIKAEAKCLKHVIFLGDDTPADMLNYSKLIADNAPIADAGRSGEDLAGLYYTGGTTGFPKGVMLPHRALWFNALSIAKACNFEAEDVYLHAAPMFHLADGGMSGAASAVGAEHSYLPMFDPQKVVDAIEQYQATHILLVPTMLAMVLQLPDFDPKRLSSLKLLMYGASPMPEGVLREAIEKLPNVNFIQGYGQTELAPVGTILPPAYHALEGPMSSKLRSAGRAPPGVEIRIVNEEHEDVPSGAVGEIAVKSPGAMHGYWNLPEQTASALQDGWIFTGDGGYRDEDGFIFIVDRMKDMIVTGGENVFSAEVESAISTHPAVAEVAVIGIPAEKWGEAVHAIVVLREGMTMDEGEVIAHCRDKIANYKLPRSASFQTDPLPLSGAGKVLKRDLRKPYWQDADRNVS